MSDFTIEELLAAMDEARVGEARGADGVRVQELRELTGRSEATLTRQLRRLIAAGRVEYVPVKFTRIDGVQTTVAGYRLKDEQG